MPFTSLFQTTWMIQFFSFLAVLIVVNFFLRRVFDRFKRRKHLQDGDWRVQLDHTILAPVRALLWIFFGAFLLKVISRHFGFEQEIPDPAMLRNAGVVFCLAWFFFRWKILFEKALRTKKLPGKKALDPTSIEIISKIYSVLVLFLSSLILLQIFGLDIAPLLAFSGIGAAALGFASKDAISNFYGGLTIYLTRPFTVNDFINLPQRELLGTVEQIGWYFTTLRDLAKQPVYIPNGVFGTELIVNLSRMTHRRIDESFSLRYADADKIEKLILQIRDYLSKHPEIDQNESTQVFVSTFAESGIVLEVKAYTLSTRYEEFMEIKQRIMLKLCEMIAFEGAGIGYPVREMVYAGFDSASKGKEGLINALSNVRSS